MDKSLVSCFLTHSVHMTVKMMLSVSGDAVLIAVGALLLVPERLSDL